MDFGSEKELVTQTGHPCHEWPLVIVKELIDNALDACDEAGVHPVVKVVFGESSVTVTDNGPGLPDSTIEKVVDFGVRASNREAYVAPDRGAQGNALKTLVAIPYVIDPDEGCISITSSGKRREIRCRANPLTQSIEVAVETESVGETGGTEAVVSWSTDDPFGGECEWELCQLVRGYTVFNPHLDITLDLYGDVERYEPTSVEWRKWKPSQPTSPHWYEQEHLERLIGAYIAHDRESGSSRTVADFVGEFDGLTSTAKRKRVLDAVGLQRQPLEALVTEDDVFRDDDIARLLGEMQAHTRPVSVKRLGIVGCEHVTQQLESFGCVPESVTYEKVAGVVEGVPFVLEAGFGWLGDDADDHRLALTGVNWSAGIRNQFRTVGANGAGLDAQLVDQRVGVYEPVVFVLHLAHPRVEYTDRGKTALAFGSSGPNGGSESTVSPRPESRRFLQEAVEKITEKATRRWTKQRKAEERDRQARLNRRFVYGRRVNFTDVLGRILPGAYEHASGGGRLPVSQRQLYYSARDEFREHAGRAVDYKDLSQRLIPRFLNENPELTAGWKVTADARGSLVPPHGGDRVPLGTLDVDRYLDEVASFQAPVLDVPQLDTQFPCRGPGDRYRALLYIEKEGFGPLLREARIADWFDIAIASCKGQSVVAIRRLIDEFCGPGGIPLFVVHDFDKSGFEIAARLTSVSESARAAGRVRYEFENEINVIDFGLRLEDVEERGLAAERCEVSGKIDLIDATDQEKAYLASGRRVELNAFTSPDLVSWLEKKLRSAGLTEKHVPEDDVLEAAYRRAVFRESLNAVLRREAETLSAAAAGAAVPEGLRKTVLSSMELDDTRPWDAVLAEIVREGGD